MATTRLRLTLSYLAVLAIVIGLMSLAFYVLLLHARAAAVIMTPLVRPAAHRVPEGVGAIDAAAVVRWLGATDLGVLLLGALGAYMLAGRTL
ncbi:MAG: hypothetical protein JOY78_12795, partial [Pseudonocardia sp.]|nr:hypothetical protein [Pseudonocardia sp.]